MSPLARRNLFGTTVNPTMTSVLNAIQEVAMNGRSVIRVLVVDDFGPWCGYVISGIQTKQRWIVVGVARDGNEAVQKAEELQPDLILLDIRLPRLNGIEATRLILKNSPCTRILFVSSEADPELAQVGFRAGGQGYVVKTDAADELFPAMDATLQGKRYVSRSLAGYGLSEPEDE
jgi:DNA-binding NarL/FixJ family response regulator